MRPCGDTLAYITEIPTSVAGTLFGTVELFQPDGTLIGVTSTVASDAAAAPEIDLDALCG